MNETGTYGHKEQSKKVDELQLDCRNMKSRLGFVHTDMVFIKKMLKSYIFEPNAPNLFERLQGYLGRLDRNNSQMGELKLKISKHEGHLGGMMECADDRCDAIFYREHEKLKAEMESYMTDFQELKAEIFDYAGGILKKRKPTK